MHRCRSFSSLVVSGIALTLVAVVAISTPSQGATASAFASAWSVNNDADWTPYPSHASGANPLGPSNNLCTGTSTPAGSWAIFTFPSLGIPGADFITGIQINVDYRSVGANTAQLTQSGALIGSSQSVPLAFEGTSSCDFAEVVTAGGDGDLWGTAVTAAQLNTAGPIGVRILQVANTIDLDSIELVVYHASSLNTAPTAEAGGPYNVAEGGSVMLSGAGSSDAEQASGTLSYAWDFDNNGSYETPGISPTFSAASLSGPSSATVGLQVTDDGALTDTDTATVNISNVAPTVAAPNVAPEPSDEGASVTASATFSDPAAALDAPYTCTVNYGDGSGALAGTVAGMTCNGPAHTYDDDGSFTVNVVVTDKDGGFGSNDTTHEVLNVPPAVAAPTTAPEPSDEGESVVTSATFSDPGGDDSPFTCTVDYGEGTVAGTVAGNTCTGPPHTFGDDGSFPVTVAVTDKDDATGSNVADHPVANVNPEVTLDTTGAIAFPGGNAFLGSQGVSQDHDAEGEDPGSDDLTFDWSFPPSGNASSTTYFNDTGDPMGTPDPLTSPDGTFPLAAADQASVTFSDPGLYTVIVALSDDDGGSAGDELAKLVTGGVECTRSQGFWRKQFSPKGHHHFDSATLQAFLDIVDFASAVFSELVPAATPAQANVVFAPGGPSMRAKATQQALAAWLNFASGAVAHDQPIGLNGDAVPDVTYLGLMNVVESILLDPAATHSDLVEAKDLAEAVNLLEEGDPSCAN